MEQIRNLLFITFVLKRQRRALDIRCFGCREMLFSDYKKPTHIKGVIEFEGHYVPVMDPSIWLCGEPTRLDHGTCILVAQHSFDYRPFKTGILVPDSEEILNLAAGAYTQGAVKGTSFNMRFILEIPTSTFANKFLADSHRALDLCEEKERMEDDYATFRKILSRELARA